ncbi:Vgb family protein [Marinicella meishanensis]|uniref:Vgb family protein n=1 Tax=Marinicella meishanensis TaxID=2873263 RepID=UPI001CBE4BF0|nr:hypothetical protein [Marinicella sp. NBU2979]
MQAIHHQFIWLFLWLFIFGAEAGQVTTLTPTPFQASGDVAVAPNGDIFVADYGVKLSQANGSRVYRVTPASEVSVWATGFFSATGNVIGPDGALYQSNGGAVGVDRIDAAGNKTPYARNGGIAGPIGLAFDSAGNLFVNNCGNNTVSKVNLAGGVSLFSDSPLLSCPNGLAIDEADNLYAVNFNNGIVVKITPAGEATFFARTPGAPNKPAGGNGHIAYGNDQLYLVSNATHQVFGLSLTGELTVIAGSGQAGRDDGDALTARFSLPNGIDVSPDGSKLYVNDSAVVGTQDDIAPNVLRVIELDDPNNGTGIMPNDGLTGAWHNLDISGQGLLVDIKTDIGLFFAAWFTYDDEVQGALRWLTIQGELGSGPTIEATIFNTTGGLFNALSETETLPVGTAEMRFLDCSTAQLSYQIDGGLSGTIDLERSVPNVFCE